MAYSIDDDKLNRMRLLIDNERDLKRKLIRDQMNKHYTNSYQAPIATTPSSRDSDIKISELTSENQKLKTQYGDLIKKTNLLIDAYRKLEAENEKLKIKKDRRESWDKSLSGLWEGVEYINKSIIKWFNS